MSLKLVSETAPSHTIQGYSAGVYPFHRWYPPHCDRLPAFDGLHWHKGNELETSLICWSQSERLINFRPEQNGCHLPILVANITCQFKHSVNTVFAASSLVKWTSIKVTTPPKWTKIWVVYCLLIGISSIRLYSMECQIEGQACLFIFHFCRPDLSCFGPTLLFFQR